jgi:S-adenosylmethionine:tRNA ribosyltransferase-isomerase
MYQLSDYFYELPQRCIAQAPALQRDCAKMLYLNRKTGVTAHYFFHDIYSLLRPTDIVVINDTKVIPARLFGRKVTGGKAEILLLENISNGNNPSKGNDFRFKCLIKASKRSRQGTKILFSEDLEAEVVGIEDEFYTVKFHCKSDFWEVLYRIGNMPLPPYIRRDDPENDGAVNDRDRYQTVYACNKGAIAAPTAGLHFNRKLLEKIRKNGNPVVSITLHVGYGTFVPVRVADIREHHMHPESFYVSDDAAQLINKGKKDGRRIIAVGTTCVRTLEYIADKNGTVSSGHGRCDLFIYPGYDFKVIDAMITNFHLPESTLLMLVSAFAGRMRILSAYREAIEKNYRFYSYGDAMFIE